MTGRPGIWHHDGMSISITQGKARLFPVTATMSNGAIDTALPAVASTNQSTKVKIMMNPADNREVGVLALAPTSGAQANVTVNGQLAAQVIVSVPAPTLQSVAIGADAGEIDPPFWLV